MSPEEYSKPDVDVSRSAAPGPGRVTEKAAPKQTTETSNEGATTTTRTYRVAAEEVVNLGLDHGQGAVQELRRDVKKLVNIVIRRNNNKDVRMYDVIFDGCVT